MMLSVVSTLYYSANHLEEFHERVSKTVKKITDDYEIILVNDGSPDVSIEIAMNLQKKDSRLRVIDLSRNFGHYKAIMTGLEYTKGEYVFLIDCDLEEEPELVLLFWQEIKKSDVDVVYGVQKNRKGKFFERVSGWFFYTIFNFLTSVRIPRNVLTVRIMSKRYVKALVQFKEREIMLIALMELAGFKQRSIFVKKFSCSKTTYTFKKKFLLMINSIIAFSIKPLLMVSFIGMLLTMISFLAILFLIIKKIFWGYAVGWTSLIVSIWAVGGLLLFSLGILGIYISKIFIEVKQRPYTIIKKIYESNT